MVEKILIGFVFVAIGLFLVSLLGIGIIMGITMIKEVMKDEVSRM